LIADLHDTSPNEKRFVKKMEFLLESGLRAVTLLAISDQGQPSFNADLAGKLAKLECPVSAAPRPPSRLAGRRAQRSRLAAIRDNVR